MVYRMVKHTLCSNFASCGSRFVGILAPLTVPPLHILFLFHFWQDYARDVDRQYCSCSCWDTVFKGSYESGIASYKHMYFNATTNSLKIWASIVIGIVVFYETSKYLTWLAFHRRLRFGMFILFMFFSITELISTIFVIQLADKKTAVTHRKAFAISTIGLIHILAGSWDQFITNVLRGEGYAHQVVRDLGFMIPDILHVLIPLLSVRWRKCCTLPGAERDTKQTSLKRDLTCMFGIVLVGLVMCTIL
ncbi:uncharacterized protein [Venturia canescens]|uniref:uncharacterized protein isoform X2 n=1 Tax=Venturia canescens TaxID=32260 RepID=UPI001C9CFAAF|nr:uncharacterized protein LOC122414537 isoform X2 [Venturia canescens]